jgi:hypothetical protein
MPASGGAGAAPPPKTTAPATGTAYGGALFWFSICLTLLGVCGPPN